MTLANPDRTTNKPCCLGVDMNAPVGRFHNEGALQEPFEIRIEKKTIISDLEVLYEKSARDFAAYDRNIAGLREPCGNLLFSGNSVLIRLPVYPGALGTNEERTGIQLKARVESSCSLYIPRNRRLTAPFGVRVMSRFSDKERL